MPVVSPGKSGRERAAEAEAAHVPPEPLWSERQADLDGADVARLHHHVGERQRPVVVRVVDHARSESDFSARHVDQIVDADDVLFDARRSRSRP